MYNVQLTCLPEQEITRNVGGWVPITHGDTAAYAYIMSLYLREAVLYD